MKNKKWVLVIVVLFLVGFYFIYPKYDFEFKIDGPAMIIFRVNKITGKVDLAAVGKDISVYKDNLFKKIEEKTKSLNEDKKQELFNKAISGNGE